MKTDSILENKKIAIVCDWIKDWGGAELVLSHLLEIFPNADIFTSVFYQEWNPVFAGRAIHTSFIQKLPFVNKRPKLIPFLRPHAFRSFNFTGYDLVISSSSAESKGVITQSPTIHVCYCHTPTRYFWSHYEEYLNMMEFAWLNPIARIILPLLIKRLRAIDYEAAQRPDFFIANSVNTQRRITEYYHRESTVIYPGVDTSKSKIVAEKKDYYFAIGRAIPYKKFDLLVDAFNISGKRLIIATSTRNQLLEDLMARSKPNIEWRIGCSDTEKVQLFSEAHSFLFPPEEDFGLVPIEAMTCGTPVIAYGKWWALETVVDGETGVFFDEQTVEGLNGAIERFEGMSFDAEKIRKHAKEFDKRVFQERMVEFVEEKIEKRE